MSPLCHFTSLLPTRCHLLCLAGSDCKPCLREFADHSNPALEYPSPKTFLPSLIAEDDAFCSGMAEEKASVPFPSAATARGRSQGQRVQRGCSGIRTGRRAADPDYQGIRGYIASAAGKNHTDVILVLELGGIRYREMRGLEGAELVGLGQVWRGTAGHY